MVVVLGKGGGGVNRRCCWYEKGVSMVCYKLLYHLSQRTCIIVLLV